MIFCELYFSKYDIRCLFQMGVSFQVNQIFLLELDAEPYDVDRAWPESASCFTPFFLKYILKHCG